MPDQTLAQRIRSKYPGVYDDLADIELEEKVSAKFPGAYDDIPRTESTLTLERPMPGAKTPLGHHPEIEAGLAADQVSPFSAALGQVGAEAGRVSKDNLPAIAAGTAALATGGASLPVTVGAAALGGMAGRGAQQQMEQGAHVPTLNDAKDAALTGAWEGGTQLAGGLAGKAIAATAPALTKAAGRVSSSALKVKDTLARKNPGLDIPLEAAKRGARISPKGARALDAEIGGLKREVTDAVDESAATIRPSDAALEARDLLRSRKALGSVAADDVAQIRDEIRAFVGSNEPVPAAKMQKIKEFLQGKLKNKFGASTTPARVDAQQALRSGTRSSIEKTVPEVQAPNAEMRRLIPIRDAVKDALKRTDKWDLAQIIKASGGGVLGGVAGMATGSPVAGSLGTVAGAAAARALDNPLNKSRIASALFSAGEKAEPVGNAVGMVGPLIARVARMKAAGDLSDEETDALVDTLFEDAGGSADLSEPVGIDARPRLPIRLRDDASSLPSRFSGKVPIPMARK